MTRRGLWTFLFFFLAIPSFARADFIDDAISFYNPKFVIARKAITCMADGGAFDACALKLGASEANNALNELKKDPDFANVIGLVKAVQKNDYPEVLARAGLGAACAWIEFPGKSLVCSDFAGEAIEAGKEAIKAQYEMGKAVINAVADIGKEIYSAGKAIVKNVLGGGGGGGSKTTITVDGEKTWHDCYAPNIQKGIIYRLGNSNGFDELVSHNRNNGLFAENSLAGNCFNGILLALGTPIENTNKPPNTSKIIMVGAVKKPPAKTGDDGTAAQLASAVNPLRNKFFAIVEDAAFNSLSDKIDNYQNLRNIYKAKPALRAAEIFTKGKPGFAAKLGETALCADALDKEDAKAIGKWAEVSKNLGKPPLINIDGQTQNWANSAGPQPHCRDDYYPALEKEIMRRFEFYSKALNLGCIKVQSNDYLLACPKDVGRSNTMQIMAASAMQNCESAFSGTNGKCVEKPQAIITPKLTPTIPKRN